MKSAIALLFGIVALGAAGFAPAARAETVSAMKPASVVAALQAAGYTAQAGVDEGGDPLVQAEIGGWRTLVVFYDCNDITHEGCQSLQFNASFQPERPFDAARAAAFSRDNRFAVVSVGADKAVNVTWDVVTGPGLDPAVFALVLKSYRLALDTLGGEVFAGGRPRLASASR